MIRELTRNAFKDLKKNYSVYGTHMEQDKYNNEYTVVDDVAKCTVNTMWHPITDEASIAEYGSSVKRMYYCILYGDDDIEYNDIVLIADVQYEVVGIKQFNTYTRIDVRKKEV